MRHWLKQPVRDRFDYPDVLGPVADWIDARNWDDIAGLSKLLWDKVGGPPAGQPVK